MSTDDRLALASAVAVLLAATALVPVYADLGWVLPAAGAVTAVAVSGALARLGGLPRIVQPLASVLGLGAFVVLAFATPTLAYRVLPTTGTAELLAGTLRQGLLEVREFAAPVPATPGLVLLAVLGTGAVVIAVDAFAVVLRQAALAGTPLLLLLAIPSAVLPTGLGLVPFTLGAGGWLGLLLVDGGDRASRWARPLRTAAGGTGTDPAAGRVARRIGATALSVAVVVPALVPGLDGRLLSGRGDGPGFGRSSTTSSYDPLVSLAGQLRLPSPKPILSYTTTGEPDYLRLTTLDRYDPDTGWSSSGVSADRQDDAVQDGIPQPAGITAPTDTVELDIDLAGRLDGPWLPMPFGPQDVRVDGPWLWDAEAETVFSTRVSVQDVQATYAVRSSRVLPDAELLRRPQRAPAAIREAYAQEPELSAYTRELLETTTGAATNAYDKVVALQSLFTRTDFVYSEDASVPGMNAPDALENFLRGKRGFCQQYASAMGAMVRALGLPVRVAVGFTAGNQDADGRYVVTTDQAHAWPEVWFGGAGWVRFEPTPRRTDVDTPAYSVPPAQGDSSEAAAAARPAAPAGPQGASEPGAGAVDRGGEENLSSSPAGRQSWTDVQRLVPAALAVLLLAAVPAMLGAARRRRRLRSPSAACAWDVVRDDAADVGHRWRLADSPRAAASHLQSLHPLPPAAGEAVRRLADQAERARYARSAPAPDAKALRRDVACVRQALLGAAPAGGRWRALLAPPSAVRAAYTTAGSTVTSLGDVANHLSAATAARLRRRARTPRA